MNQDLPSQKLSAEEIQRLKQSAMRPEELIEIIRDNNQQFDLRTQYSQKKYLNKKNKRYLLLILVTRLTPETLCDCLFSSEKAIEIAFLRQDSLALFL